MSRPPKQKTQVERVPITVYAETHGGVVRLFTEYGEYLWTFDISKFSEKTEAERLRIAWSRFAAENSAYRPFYPNHQNHWDRWAISVKSGHKQREKNSYTKVRKCSTAPLYASWAEWTGPARQLAQYTGYNKREQRMRTGGPWLVWSYTVSSNHNHKDRARRANERIAEADSKVG